MTFGEYLSARCPAGTEIANETAAPIVKARATFCAPSPTINEK